MVPGPGKIIGVFKDFHFESLHQKIAAIVVIVPSGPYGYNRLSVKISGDNISAALSHIEKTWKKFLPETPYQYTFLDENFDKLYKAEEKQKVLLTIFACLAIFIGCLGLVWFIGICNYSKNKRNRHKKSIGCKCWRYCAITFKRLFKACRDFCNYCISCCMVFYE